MVTRPTDATPAPRHAAPDARAAAHDIPDTVSEMRP
jgi:hypothetical protein